MKHIPKKSLGQHFLTDKNMIGKILRAINAGSGDRIIEIGPGRGALTHDMIDSGCDLVSFELDRDLAKEWMEIANEHRNFKCVEADAVKLDWTPYLPVDKCVGNIPYNISRPLLYKVLEYRDKMSEVVFMVQKEFADKLIAKPGDDAYGIPSVLSQSFARVDYLFSIPPSVFNPPPKVMSACIKMTFNDLTFNDTFYIDIVQQAFNQRRKTLRNSLRSSYSPDLENLFEWDKRADEISALDYIQLVKILFNT